MTQKTPKTATNIDLQLQLKCQQLLPRRISFIPAISPASSFVPPNPKYRPINHHGDPTANLAEPDHKNHAKTATLAPTKVQLQVPLEWMEIRAAGPGLRNLGNTCFLNSTLQCLVYTPPLVNLLTARRHSPKCRALGFCIYCQLEKHMENVMGSRSCVSPTAMVKNIRTYCTTFRYGRQEDAHEYMRFVISGLQSKEIPLSPNQKEVKSSESDIFSIFGGYLRSEVFCYQCKGSSFKYDEFLDLSLEITNLNTLEKCLSHFTAPEILEKRNAYACQKCKTLTKATKRFTFQTPPAVLVIQLKRFSMKATYTRLTWEKNKSKLKYPQTLDLSPYLSSSSSISDQKNTKSENLEKNPEIALYELYGVLIHEGSTMNSGHYYSIIKCSNGSWYTFDDERVSHSNVQDALRQEAYILFYIKKSNPPQNSDLSSPAPKLKKADSSVEVTNNGNVPKSQKIAEKNVKGNSLNGNLVGSVKNGNTNNIEPDLSGKNEVKMEEIGETKDFDSNSQKSKISGIDGRSEIKPRIAKKRRMSEEANEENRKKLKRNQTNDPQHETKKGIFSQNEGKTENGIKTEKEEKEENQNSLASVEISDEKFSQNETKPIVEKVTGIAVLKELEDAKSSQIEEIAVWDVGDESTNQQLNQLKSDQVNQIKEIEAENRKSEFAEWDKSLDKGRVKKVKAKKVLSQGRNPFQARAVFFQKKKGFL